MFNRRTAVILHDLFMVAVAWCAAMILPRAFAPGFEWTLEALPPLKTLLVVLFAQSLFLWYYGLYRGLWRFASLPDLWNILRSVGLGTLGVSLALILFNRMQDIPRSAFYYYPVLLILLLGGPRLLYRLWREHSLDFLRERIPKQRVLIIGAGQEGEALVRDMRRNHDYLPVAFLDDQPRLAGGRVQDVPVLGNTDNLAETVKRQAIDLVIIATPAASDEQMQRIVERCEQSGVVFRTLPKLLDMAQPSLKTVREVAIDDLLGREKVQLDWSNIAASLQGKVVMVSGGGGSIGAELCHQIARLDPAALVIFERYEFNLYQVEMRLRQAFPDLPLHLCLSDVCDDQAVRHCLRSHRPSVIFHAAAHKHVPLLQGQVREAVRNNVLGTRLLAEAALAHGCEAFVLISTDKAVNPSNVMGATKRLGEMVCQSLKGPTRFATVRFGNVLGSAGSVVPLFQKQIAQGGPVTVTHPEITRYFMTIPEACQLILQAAAMGRGGEIFVLDMGKPIKIRYLAEQLIRLSGKQPGLDIPIVYSGLRPGEKLHEELFYADEEQFSRTRHQKILLASSRGHDWTEISETLDSLCRACEVYDEAEIRRLLQRLVPEFSEAEA
jgi:FlaA1/EpsC-like NDP-sugar epimerase